MICDHDDVLRRAGVRTVAEGIAFAKISINDIIRETEEIKKDLNALEMDMHRLRFLMRGI